MIGSHWSQGQRLLCRMGANFLTFLHGVLVVGVWLGAFYVPVSLLPYFIAALILIMISWKWSGNECILTRWENQLRGDDSQNLYLTQYLRKGWKILTGQEIKGTSLQQVDEWIERGAMIIYYVALLVACVRSGYVSVWVLWMVFWVLHMNQNFWCRLRK